jgi:hypothetical protein
MGIAKWFRAPAVANAMRLLRERPHIPFGIHVALIRHWPEYRWANAQGRRSRQAHPNRGAK